MQQKRSSPLKWGAWGAFIGLAFAAVRADYDGLVLAGLLGHFTSSAAAGGLLGGLPFARKVCAEGIRSSSGGSIVLGGSFLNQAPLELS